MKIINNYTLDDLCENVINADAKDESKLPTLLFQGYDGAIKSLNLYGISEDELYQLKNEDNALVININPYTKLLNLIRLRFDDHYCVSSENELDFSDLDDKSLKTFAKKFIGILCQTKDKYVSILDIYQNNINKLMDGLKGTIDLTKESHRDEDYDSDVNSKNLFNDTPQTTDVVATMEEDQYVSELSKSTAHTDNTGDIDESGEEHHSSENNTKYTMEKIKDIQDSFEKVLYRWSEEFHGLFIEEDMIR